MEDEDEDEDEEEAQEEAEEEKSMPDYVEDYARSLEMHTCTANTVSAKVVWTSHARAGQKDTKAILLR